MKKIITYQAQWEAAMIKLWQDCDLTRPWNDPHKDIARKLADKNGQFLLLVDEEKPQDQKLIGSVMVGFDGHRGSINYLAIAPNCQSTGNGAMLMDYCEQWLLEQGCPKINLCVRDTNIDVLAFYKHRGYAPEPVVLMGKRLIED